MNGLRILVVVFSVLLLSPFPVSAGDFDWMKDMNLRAEADPSGFRARLEARFRVAGIDVEAVLGHVGRLADAYVLFRLGEMSNQPMDRVVERYRAQKGKGWGALAKSLGIKPGSREFHALKQGQDLYDGAGGGKAGGKGRGHSEGKGRKK